MKVDLKIITNRSMSRLYPIIYLYMINNIALYLFLNISIDLYNYNEYICTCLEVRNGNSGPDHRGSGGIFEVDALHGAGLCQAGNSAGPQGGQGVAVL